MAATAMAQCVPGVIFAEIVLLQLQQGLVIT